MKLKLKKLLQSIWAHEDGVTTVEYALLLTLIVVLSIGAVLATGDVQQLLWFDTASKVQSIVPGN